MEKIFDFMAIGAHPDDVEIMAGGTVAKLTQQGYRGVILDLTDAALGTRGTPQIRFEEAKAAAKVLGIQERVNLGLPDGHLENSLVYQVSIAECIRYYRPKIILTHYGTHEDHPDHKATADLTLAAAYKAGLKKLNCQYEPFRPARVFHFLGYANPAPHFCIDITDTFTTKLKAIQSFKSQFFNSESTQFEGKTDISSPEFLEYLEVQNRFYGQRIRRKYAEGFCCKEIPEVQDLIQLGGQRF